MIHLLFHHNILLNLLHRTLLNKVPLIQMAQISFKPNQIHNFKLLPHQDNQFYKLYRTIRHKQHIQIIQPSLTINTLHSNTLPNNISSRNLSRPPLQTIPTNPLSYSLTSTIPNNTQHSLTLNNQQSKIPSFSTSHPYKISQNMTQNTQSQTSSFVHNNIRTNPHINAAYTLKPNPSITPTYNTVPSTIPQGAVSTPTYINSSTSISEPIKPFDGSDHNYTPEEYLQHIEARVTFSSGLQPTSDDE